MNGDPRHLHPVQLVAGGRQLQGVQSFGSVENPRLPKSVARAEWGPKFPSTGNKKLLAFGAPQQPQKPAEVASSRFAPRKATSNAAAQGDR